MALLFQSNPDQWDLRKAFFLPGHVLWFVTRYLNFMRPGSLVLFWQAHGSQSPNVRGLYGWGISSGEPVQDEQGRLRLQVDFVERWVSAADVINQTPETQHMAPVPAAKVLALPAWQDHLLATMPVGTNFLVTPRQLEELKAEVLRRFPASNFDRAVESARAGKALRLDDFQQEVIKEQAHVQQQG